MEENPIYEGVVYKRTLQTDCAQKGFSWVGYTLNEKQRKHSWNNHGNKSYGGKKIQAAREKYGIESFDYDVLERRSGTDKEALKKELKELEAHYIKQCDSIEHGFNQSESDSSNYRHTPEHTAKMVATRKARGNYAHTPETRAKMSIANSGRHHTQATKDLIASKLKGRPMSNSAKQKLSIAMKGRVISAAARAKSSATKKGKKHPISAQGMANINAARYKTPVAVTFPDGHSEDFESTKAVGRLGYAPGSVLNYIKTGRKTKEGYTFAYTDGVKNLPKKRKP